MVADQRLLRVVKWNQHSGLVREQNQVDRLSVAKIPQGKICGILLLWSKQNRNRKGFSMKISAADLAKALEAMNWVLTQRDTAPDGLKFEDLLHARISIKIVLDQLSAEVEV